MSVSPQRSSGFRAWRVILVTSFFVALLFGLLWMGLDMTAKLGLTEYEQQWEARGEHFNFADFVPKPVPDASNFALTPIVVSSYARDLDKNGRALNPKNNNVVDRLDMEIHEWPEKSGNWALGEKTDLKAFQLYYRSLPARANPFPVAPRPQTPAADVLLALSKYDQNIEELRQASALPDSRFPHNYDCEPPDGILLPQLRPLNKCAETLQLRGVAELARGQSDKALADVKLILRLMASLRNEPFDVSQLFRIGMFQLALQPVWEGIEGHLWSDAQLRELDKDLAGLDFLADYGSTMRSLRAFEIANIEYIRRTGSVGMLNGDRDVMPVASEIELRFSSGSTYYENELVYAQACQNWMLPIADPEGHIISLEAVQSASTNIDQMRLHWSLNDVLAALLLPALETCAQRFSYAQSAADMARVACALERYRLAAGQYPESLDALAPGCMESVPSDVMDGQPLKYHRTGDGRFVLYSVGWNGTDDGGKVFSKPNLKMVIDYGKGDWVWTGQVLEEELPAAP
jgi:hypothetical protein